MIRMQTFYSQLQNPVLSMTASFLKLLRISQASLKDVLVVRSELAWEQWTAE